MNRLVLWLLRSPLGALVERQLAALRYTARDGRSVVLPVQPARKGQTVVVLVGAAEHKTWWRHFRRPAEVEVWVDGRWRPGVGRVQTGGAGEAAATYRLVRPGARLDGDATFVRIDLEDRRGSEDPDLFEGTGAPGEPRRPVPPLAGRRLTRLWFWTVTLAEFTGFAIPAVVGALTADAERAVQVPALLGAGLVEGSLLGLGQAAVLRSAIPQLPSRPWIGATAVAAMCAYGIGLLPSLFAESLAGWPDGILVVAAVLAGLVLLCSIGTAQWLVLRRHVDGAGRWIVATAVAWLVGLAVFTGITTPLWQPGQQPALIIAIGLLGGLAMAATTSAITGRALSRIIG